MQATIFDIDRTGRDWFGFGLFTDMHTDAKDCARKKLRADIERCISENRRLLFGGDVVEFIFKSDRKRYSSANSMFQSDGSMSQAVMFNYEFYKPYADYIDIICVGNHETSALKYNNFDPTQHLVWELNKVRSDKLRPIQIGGYKGYIRLKFRCGDNGGVRDYTIMYYHGRGGDAPITKGMIDFSRLYMNYLADCYWTGHKHTSIVDKTASTVFVDKTGSVCVKPKQAICTAGYKQIIHQDDYNKPLDFDGITMPAGYRPDFGEEQMLTTQSNGYGIIDIEIKNHKIRADVHAVRT